MPGILILDELQSATEGGGIKLKDPLQTQDGTPLLSPSGEVSINFDNLANNTIHMNKLNIPDDGMTGDKIHGGIISGFQSTGITDSSSNTVITVHSNENVGIGTSSPSAKLQVVGNTNTDVALIGTLGTRLTIQPDDTIGEVKFKVEDPSGNSYHKFMSFHTEGGSGTTERMRIDPSGNVGIGTDDPYSELTVAGSNSSTQVYKEDPVILLSKSSGTRVLDEGPSIGFNSGTSFLYGAIKGAAESSAAEFSGYLSFYTTGVTSYHLEQMRIDSSGNVGIGTISPTEKLTVSGNITASGDVTSTSDVRVKTDITPITGALDIVNKLEGKRFNKFNKPGIGFIAQELEQYMPELVHTANDEVGTKSVNYANMVALLVEAIKEQQVTINKLESKLNGN